MTALLRDVDAAAAILRGGGTVAFATETVFGLGARFDDAAAVRRVFTAKGRPSDNPLIVHVAERGEVERVAARVTESAERFLGRFAPGPLTVILPRGPHISDAVAAGLATVAVRIPSHTQARQLIHATGTPLVAPSANRSGRPSPTTWQAVQEDLAGRIDGILLGSPSEIGLESTVVDCTGQQPLMFRAGGISLEQLQQVVPETTAFVSAGEDTGPLPSPGLRHRHYSPHARVVIVQRPPNEATGRAMYLGTDAPASFPTGWIVKRYENVEAYARDLFAAFREADQRGIDTIYCQQVATDGIGRALMDRLQRATSD